MATAHESRWAPPSVRWSMLPTCSVLSCWQQPLFRSPNDLCVCCVVSDMTAKQKYSMNERTCLTSPRLVGSSGGGTGVGSVGMTSGSGDSVGVPDTLARPSSLLSLAPIITLLNASTCIAVSSVGAAFVGGAVGVSSAMASPVEFAINGCAVVGTVAVVVVVVVVLAAAVGVTVVCGTTTAELVVVSSLAGVTVVFVVDVGA